MTTLTVESSAEAKERRLLDVLASRPALAVAFSGGVDSSYLLAAAVAALGPARVIALTADSPFTPRHELEAARQTAAQIGARHIVLPLNPLEEPAVVANPPDRCYYCKQAVFSALLARARQEGASTLAHGANADDRNDYRPGQRAADELGVIAPLDEAGLTKSEIRELSRRRGLPTWDMPAQACLATRIPFGTALDAETLGQIERAEDFLRRRFGLRALRVRRHGVIARLELPPEAWPALLEPAARAELLAAFQALGFGAVTLDLAGLRSGSMNVLHQKGSTSGSST